VPFVILRIYNAEFPLDRLLRVFEHLAFILDDVISPNEIPVGVSIWEYFDEELE